MFAPFPQEKAYEYCIQTVNQIQSGEYSFVKIRKESLVRSQHGFMIGVLVCSDINNGTVILKTISGIANKLIKAKDSKDTSIFVDPIVTSAQTDGVLLQTNNRTQELNLLIEKETQKGNIKKAKELKAERTYLCTKSLKQIRSLYRIHCINKSVKSLNDIIAEQNLEGLPHGAGECCAPKLLDYAFSHNLTPLSLCEVYYNLQENSCDLTKKYTPCNERCAPLLKSMLGLQIIYRDNDICIVNKQSGLLSVPGRLEQNKDSVVTRFKALFPGAIEQCAVHRLDQDTSGIMILAFNKQALRALSLQFEKKTVTKQYIALIDANLIKQGIAQNGTNTLYLCCDYPNRPKQMYDRVNGKIAVTQWQILRVEKYYTPQGKRKDVTRVLFTPKTGRSHQLRLCASSSHGFGYPIVGDCFYGTKQKGERLMLHASYIKFIHPVTNKVMEINCPCPF